MALNTTGINGPRQSMTTGRNRRTLTNMRSKQTTQPGALDRPKVLGVAKPKVPEVGETQGLSRGPSPGTELSPQTAMNRLNHLGKTPRQFQRADIPTSDLVPAYQQLSLGATSAGQNVMSGLMQMAEMAKKAGQSATFNRATSAGGGSLAYVPGNYENWVHQAARRYGLDPRLIAAVGQTESGWSSNVNLKSSAGAVGPMQTMPFWQGAQPHNIRTYKGNIMAGSHILDSYIEQYGRRKGLAAYNAGPGGMEHGLDYAAKVLALFRQAKR